LIRVKAIINGEKDLPSFFRVFEYSNESYDTIFAASVKLVKVKLARGLKININECLVMYCNYIVLRLRAQNRIAHIEREAKNLLSADCVMTGVPETLREVVFQTELDEMPQQVIRLQEPIKIPRYVLGSGN
jgi:urease gamma subunit